MGLLHHRRLTPPPAQGSRSPLEKKMLLAALRSERNKARGGARARPEVLAPWGGPDPSFAEPAQCQGGDVAPPHPTPSLTSAPEVGQQPLPPRTHAPGVQAVLLAEGLGELQLGKDVRPVVAGEGQVDLGAGLWGAHTAIRPGNGHLVSVPTPKSSRWPIPGSPKPWRRGPSRSPWRRHRPGTAGRCRNRAPCPRSCTAALGDKGAGASGCTRPAPSVGPRAHRGTGILCAQQGGSIGPVLSALALPA